MLLIGPRYSINKINPTGGIVVLFENWITFCKKQNINYSIIDTNKSNYKNIIHAYFSILFHIIIKIKKHRQIFLHGTFKDYLFIAPFAAILSKILNKKLFLRKFAGDFDTKFQKSNFLKKTILSQILKNAEIIFWETKSLVAFGQKFNSKSIWFPNVRYQTQISPKAQIYSKKFVFISQVRKEKGIDIILKTFKNLDPSYTIDIYGPLIGYTTEDLKSSNISYKRALLPEEVLPVLSQYDMLILPSFREGYPGIILEAFSIGVPTIATKVGGIPEIIQNGINGILIDSPDVNLLKIAIQSIDESSFSLLKKNALNSFEQFDAEKINKKNTIFNFTKQ